MIEIYTDGACVRSQNGPGGWGVYVPSTGFEDFGGDPQTTVNRMELEAIYQAVLYASGRKAVIRTDSLLSVNVLTRKWKAKKNLDLIEKIWALGTENIRLEWVRGHDGNAGNERADELAGRGLRQGIEEQNAAAFPEPDLAVLMGERMA